LSRSIYRACLPNAYQITLRGFRWYLLSLPHYIRGAETPGDVSVAAPDILTIITAAFSLHTKMCIISHAPGENRQTAVSFRDDSTLWHPLCSLFHSSGAQNLGNAYRFLEIVHSLHYYYYYLYPPCFLPLAKPLFGCCAFVQDVDI